MEQQNLVRALKALANENRLRILETIKDNKTQGAGFAEDAGLFDLTEEAVCCVDEIVDHLAMAQSSVSQHLKELHNAGLLHRYKKAQWVYYAIDHKTLERVVEYLDQFLPRV